MQLFRIRNPNEKQVELPVQLVFLCRQCGDFARQKPCRCFARQDAAGKVVVFGGFLWMNVNNCINMREKQLICSGKRLFMQYFLRVYEYSDIVNSLNFFG